MNRKLISFVLPVYNEAEVLSDFYETLSKVLIEIEAKYRLELVFINDASTDTTPSLLRDMAKNDPRILVVDLSRNFGHQISITAGFDIAHGDAVIVMDTDLQDPPSVCLDIVREWENGFEVVYAVRRTRKDTLVKKISARIFYRLIKFLSDYPIPENTGDFRLLDKRAVVAMREYREVNRYVRGISAHIGFKQKAVMFDRQERAAGETHYPLRKMLKLAADAVYSFSNMPLRIMVRVGWLVTLFSIVGMLYALIVKIFFSYAAVPGWTFIMVSVFFLGGIQFLMLGVLGEYIGRIYAESKGRPLYIVSNKYGNL